MSDDDKLIGDSTADPFDRAEAAVRLARGGDQGVAATVTKWLDADDADLRAEARRLLLGYWPNSDGARRSLEESFVVAEGDGHLDDRIMAIGGIGTYLRLRRAAIDAEIRRLVALFDRDEDPEIQRAVYETLLRALAPGKKLPRAGKVFTRDDADDDLLLPYRP